MGRLIWRDKTHAAQKARVAAIEQLDPGESAVVHAAAVVTREARIKVTDRRFVIIMLLVVGGGYWLIHNQGTNFDSFKKGQTQTNQQADYNCRQVRDGFRQVQRGFDQINAFYDKQEALTRARTDLAADVKRRAIANDESSKLKQLKQLKCS